MFKHVVTTTSLFSRDTQNSHHGFLTVWRGFSAILPVSFFFFFSSVMPVPTMPMPSPTLLSKGDVNSNVHSSMALLRKFKMKQLNKIQPTAKIKCLSQKDEEFDKEEPKKSTWQNYL